MGGLSPISGASVRLYAMGYTGYGWAPTLLATATSNASGTFGVSPFACPIGHPETYILATGGNAGSGTNLAIGQMAVLGPCNSLSSSTTVMVNELTTVAAQSALAQFSDPTGQKIGTSSTNARGLANAVLQIGTDLVNSATGAVASFWSNQSATAVNCPGGSPPVNCDGLERLDTIANILAACVEVRVHLNPQHLVQPCEAQRRRQKRRRIVATNERLDPTLCRNQLQPGGNRSYDYRGSSFRPYSRRLGRLQFRPSIATHPGEPGVSLRVYLSLS